MLPIFTSNFINFIKKKKKTITRKKKKSEKKNQHSEGYNLINWRKLTFLLEETYFSHQIAI